MAKKQNASSTVPVKTATVPFSIARLVMEEFTTRMRTKGVISGNHYKLVPLNQLTPRFPEVRFSTEAGYKTFESALLAVYEGRITILKSDSVFSKKLDILLEVEKKAEELANRPRVVIEVTPPVNSPPPKPFVPVVSNVQRIVVSKETLTKGMPQYLVSSFGAPLRYKFTIPETYLPLWEINVFMKYLEQTKKLRDADPAFKSENLALSSENLLAGKTYYADFWPAEKVVTSEDCVTFLEELNSIFAGGNGLTLLIASLEQAIPEGGRVVSFGQTNLLWIDEDNHVRVPYVRKKVIFDLSLMYYFSGLEKGDWLVSIISPK